MEQSLRLNRFFSKLFNEIVYLKATQAAFNLASGNFSVSIGRGGSEIKSIDLRNSWYKPIKAWLKARACDLHLGKEGVCFTERTSDDLPFAAVRLKDQVVSFRVKQQRKNKSALMELSEIASCSLSTAFDRFSVNKKNHRLLRNIIDAQSGLIIVAAPDEKSLEDSLISVQVLSQAHYFDLPLNSTNIQSLAKAAKDYSVLIGIAAPNILEVLLQGKKLGINYDEMLLAGVVMQTFLPRSCQACLETAELQVELFNQIPKSLKPKESMVYPKAEGCSLCADTKTSGLIGLQSLVALDSADRRKLSQSVGKSELAELLYTAGTRPLIVDGLRKAAEGLVPFEKLLGAVTLPRSFANLVSPEDFDYVEPVEEVETSIDFFTEVPLDEVKKESELVDDTALNVQDDFLADKPESDVVKPDEASPKKPVILVVEDDKDQRNILEMVLKMSGYEVRMAANGMEALTELKNGLPDLIISDLMMPKMSGTELVQALKENAAYRNIPVLILTVLSDADKEYTLLDLGADDYCEKTVQRKVLLKRIENLLKRSKQPTA